MHAGGLQFQAAILLKLWSSATRRDSSIFIFKVWRRRGTEISLMESHKTLGGELAMHIEGLKGQHKGKVNTGSISSPSEATALSGALRTPMTPRTPERRQLRVLEALDEAKTQYYHVSAILIAGMGFYTDAYDLFCIPVVTSLLGRLYYQKSDPTIPGVLPIGVNAAVSGVALVGAFLGQLVFGWLGDKLGRKKAYGVTLGMMFVFSIASGFSMGRTPNAVMISLCFFRFWLGVGIGGDYPLSATIMAEYANTKTRGAFMAAVFAMQGLGILSGGIAGLTLSYAFNKGYPSKPPSTVHEADFMWRILVMLGAIPAAATFYYRMRMPETARYTALVKGNTQKAASDMTKVLKVPALGLSETAIKVRGSSEYGLMSREFLRNHGLHLLGTSSTWFLLDIAFYSQNLFQSTIFNDIGWTPKRATVNGLREVYLISRAQILVAFCATVPGYFVTMLLVDRIGRTIIQFQGFSFMAIFMFAIAIRFNTLADGSTQNVIIFLVLYSFTFFFANFGPNTTTFIIPAELFPARLRATCHGISAACGKVGAIVGAFGFLYASQDTKGSESSPYPPGIGTKATFFILGAASIFGAAFTLLIPETKGRSLEEISKENEFNFTYWDKAGHGMKGPLVDTSSISIDTPDSYLYSKRLSTSRSINQIGTPDSLQASRLSSASINTTDTQPKRFSSILNSPDNLQPKWPSASTSS